jgi:putative component of toxin-antitoxin plasmid stabilization module
MHKDIEFLKSKGLKIEKFTDWHYRIEDELDMWPTKRKFNHLHSGDTGTYESIDEILKLFKVKHGEGDAILRDHFAGLAMQSLVSVALSADHADWIEPVAKTAYEMADAMLKSRVATQEA